MTDNEWQVSPEPPMQILSKEVSAVQLVSIRTNKEFLLVAVLQGGLS
jgi:hypothetical protein